MVTSTSSYFLHSTLIVTAFSFTTSHSGNDEDKSSSLTSVSTHCRHSPNIRSYQHTIVRNSNRFYKPCLDIVPSYCSLMCWDHIFMQGLHYHLLYKYLTWTASATRLVPNCHVSSMLKVLLCIHLVTHQATCDSMIMWQLASYVYIFMSWYRITKFIFTNFCFWRKIWKFMLHKFGAIWYIAICITAQGHMWPTYVCMYRKAHTQLFDWWVKK